MDPAGPLMRATDRPARALPDTFRYDLADATKLWCDIRQAWAGLGVAVMADRPSNRQLTSRFPQTTSGAVSTAYGAVSCGRVIGASTSGGAV